MTNQVETMLLAPSLAAGLAAAPLALVTVGWSKTGADGGGLLVYAAGYAVLALRRLGRFTWRRAAVAAALVVAVGLALVALDAATGGSSHVTRALGSGLPGELAHRWRVSYDGATRSIGAFIMFASGIALLVAVARSRPRPALVDAMLVALAVSFVVNDTPNDVALWGALGAISLLAVRARPSRLDSRRRCAPASFVLAVALALAGCGGGKSRRADGANRDRDPTDGHGGQG